MLGAACGPGRRPSPPLLFPPGPWRGSPVPSVAAGARKSLCGLPPASPCSSRCLSWKAACSSPRPSRRCPPTWSPTPRPSATTCPSSASWPAVAASSSSSRGRVSELGGGGTGRLWLRDWAGVERPFLGALCTWRPSPVGDGRVRPPWEPGRCRGRGCRVRLLGEQPCRLPAACVLGELTGWCPPPSDRRAGPAEEGAPRGPGRHPLPGGRV